MREHEKDLFRFAIPAVGLPGPWNSMEPSEDSYTKIREGRPSPTA